MGLQPMFADRVEASATEPDMAMTGGEIADVTGAIGYLAASTDDLNMSLARDWVGSAASVSVVCCPRRGSHSISPQKPADSPSVIQTVADLCSGD